MGKPDAERTFREVMTGDLAAPATPFARASRDFVFGDVWSRPGLSRHDRRLVTLACVAAAGSPGPMEEQVHAALNSGDLDLATMLELVLHFAVYCGWPKGSELERVIGEQSARIARENGREPEPWPVLPNDGLGENDWEKRLERGEEVFKEINLLPGAPPRTSPYRQAGVLGFVFGHLWLRPGLTRRDRRILSISCVGTTGAPTPIRMHVTTALRSGDLTKQELDEIVLQFAAYAGFATGAVLDEAVEAASATTPA
ncbi:carboxymuconolactone decarboxylase family protein [Frankia sp. AgB1.9]|uniref:carboxymuconolactone decarboxylase family protein n=1 Tax=unclassified Frankia TaxID=2632575 RepID=UPI001931EA89|nr:MULTISPECIES: carboxymuconolactone decarboxylase family protein [unclassified Frankia]MBL7490503.1 carboxymuconolactone decarboxylase family protein [Frankia sp. AgW1.1]MBL7552099.1 carboxymuconolactone decarboxylase family protein [Frankia sp. AgB1.9]MBL7620572.1 carboxymuconolactone decarboxylase family protein [Frankia sp. AgB1.8]